MKTPKEYSAMVKKKELTVDLIAKCIYSVNKRAKNYRDKIIEYKENRFSDIRHIEAAQEKKKNIMSIKKSYYVCLDLL